MFNDKGLRDRYKNDKRFHILVDNMREVLKEYSLQTVKEAAYLANNKVGQQERFRDALDRATSEGYDSFRKEGGDPFQ